MATPRRSGWLVPTLATAAVAAVLAAWFVGTWVGAQPPLPGRPQADALTTQISALGDVVARLGAFGTLGVFAAITFFLARPGDELDERALRLSRLGASAAQVWLCASLLQTFANPAFVNGVPIGLLIRPAGWATFLANSPSGLAWALSSLVAFGCALVARLARRVAPYLLALVCGVLALAFVAVTGSVTVGLNHDWATDAAIWHTLALVPLSAAAVGAMIAGSADAVRRYHALVLPLVAVGALGHAVVAWQQLAGTGAWSSSYGLATIGLAAVLAVFVVSWAVRQFTGRFTRAALAADVLAVLGYAALLTAEAHLPSPRFAVPQSIQVNYLGYEVPDVVTLTRLLTPGRPNWLWIGLGAAAVVAYLIGIARVRRLGGRWPAWRTVAWCAGWALMLYLAVSGFWEYSTVVFSWHMFVHMTVNMLVPALCVMGGPFTLLQAASRPRAEGELPGPSALVDAVARHRAFTVVFSPASIWLNYVSSLFLIYWTPLFPWLMRYHWAHQLMLLYFMVTGYLFFNLIVGVDRQVHNLPHLIRLALVISIMPFHAIFAVGILMATNLIGGDFYSTIGIGWNADLMRDQNIAGQVTWILGEIPLFIVVAALAAMWFASDKAESTSFDAAQDSGEDDAFDAYNEMLAALAERDRADERRGR